MRDKSGDTCCGVVEHTAWRWDWTSGLSDAQGQGRAQGAGPLGLALLICVSATVHMCVGNGWRASQEPMRGKSP